MRNRLLPLLSLLLGLSGSLHAQDGFRADLNGDQVVPPVPTAATGWAVFRLNADGSLSYEVRSPGLPDAFECHLVRGDESTPFDLADSIFHLDGGPEIWTGTTAPMDPADIDLLRAGLLNVSVHTPAWPGGEIRGQIHPRPVRFEAMLCGEQVVPPVTTMAMGQAEIVVQPDFSFTYSVDVMLMSGLSASLYLGDPGVDGTEILQLQGGGMSWAGTGGPLTPDEFTALQNQGMYIEVTTSMHPDGEVRGQLLDAGIPYGFGTPWSGGSATLDSSGAPMTGEAVDFRVRNALPGGSGILAASLSPDAGTFLGASLLISPNTVQQIPLSLDASGAVDFNASLPVVPGGLTVYLQFWGSEAAAWYNTPGLLLEIVDL